ncbi:unnamed protein product [Adineta steineri]|uniref:Uncharacterized protein n=1 Tax=Adineta steineri TaxID=433720 RepID=A0A819RQM4_9BILA|nr:unnamed protein product [Adineta steineri]
MHLSIRRANQNHTQKLPHINNHVFTKFVEKFIKLINEKSSNVHENHCDNTVRVLVQTGQDMVTAEQQIPIATDAKKLTETLYIKLLQELRLVIKAEKSVDDTLTAIIMILESPTADITWQKGAQRQLANLDRFIEGTQLFDEINLTEKHINLISAIINNFQLKNTSLYKWVKRVLQYHTVLLKKARLIHQKYKEIEEDVLEQDQKLILLDNKNQILSRELERTSDQIYYEWLSDEVLPSEVENHTIIIKSIEYPSLLVDPFGQYDQWMKKYYNLQKIHFDDQSKHNVVMSIKQSFLSGSKIHIKNYKYQFQISQNSSQFNLQLFLFKHSKINFHFNDYPSNQKPLQHQFYLFTKQSNKLWHDKSKNIFQKLDISLIHGNIHLLKERLPPILNLLSIKDFKQDLTHFVNYFNICNTFIKDKLALKLDVNLVHYEEQYTEP